MADSASSQTGGRRTSRRGWRPAADGPGDLDRDCAYRPQTDLGNAERFVARNAGKFLWCPALGWLVWTGQVWSRAGADEKLREAFHLTVRAIQDEAAAIEAQAKALGGDAADAQADLLKLAKTLRTHGRKSEANKAIAAIEKNAQPYLYVDVAALNADPMMFNCLSGTLKFDKALPGYMELRPHNPDDLITRLAPVDFDPAAACPLYDAFLARVQPHEEMRAFLHRWMGYSLTAHAGAQKFCVFYGTGRNGKGVFVELCSYVAGDYAEYVPIETFLQGHWQTSGAQARPDLMLLHNVRMVRSVEPDDGVRFNEALIKQITGGDPVTARDLNKPMVRFRPYLKLTVSCNYRPNVRGTDKGIWGRLKLIPWNEFIPEAEQDGELPSKLRAEASGVLNRLLDGVRQWFDIGLAFPDEVEKATADYREDSDIVGQFLGECTVEEKGARTQSSSLHLVMVAWQKARGDKPWSNKAMANALLTRGLHKKKSNGEWWLDLKLVKHEGDFVGADGKPRMREAREDAGDPPNASANRRSEDDDVVF